MKIARSTARKGRRGAWSYLMAVALLGSPAAAQERARELTLDIQRFDPISQRPGFTLVRDAEAVAPLTFTASLAFNYAMNPFELGDVETLERQVGIVDHLFGFDLGLGLAPLKWLHIGVDLPVLQLVSNSEESAAIARELGARGEGVGIGDMRLSFAFHPVRQRQNGKISFAITPFLTVPTGSRGQLVGSGAVQVGGDLALGGRWKHFRFTTQAGYVFLTDTKPVGITLADDEFRFGLGLAVPFGPQDRFEVEAELAGGAVVLPSALEQVGQKPFSTRETPAEVLVGFAWLPPDRPFFFKIGAGPGITKGFGTPDFRAMAQFGGVLRSRDTGPQDADGDGIVDADDLCPGVPEDFDGFEDADGCPEPDNDFDRILDVDDACVMDPEDYDTFEDDDGCPDPDNDGDGIPDVADACPLEPEDFDGWRDQDGCPDPDNDFDGFPDAEDACPNEPEVINGVDDLDGCPDEALAHVDVEREEIVIHDKIFFEFDSARILPRSQSVLDAVANVLRSYRDIALVEVQGHTDEKGSEAYNLDLSQRRTAAVVEALVERGIERERLLAKGYGESQPLIPNARRESEHAENRRVQFVILERRDPE